MASTAHHQRPSPEASAGSPNALQRCVVVEVVRHRKAGVLLEGRRGRRQDPREAGPRKRVADRDQVARVPEAAGDDQRHEPEGGGRPSPAARRDRHHADGQREHRREHRELGSHRQARRDRRQHPCARTLGVGHQQRHGREQEEHRDHVVGGAARLRVVHHRRPHRERRADRRRGADAARTADAVRGQQGEHEPHQIQGGRQRVAPEEHDPEPVQHLRRRRIERREVFDVGEPQSGDAPGLGEARRPREVVPERVEPADADVVGLDRQRPPLGDHGGAGEQRHRCEQPGARFLVTVAGDLGIGERPGSSRAGEPASDHDRTELEQAHRSEHLEDRDQHRQPDHGLRQPSRRPGPIAEPAPAQPDRRQRDSADHDEQGGRAERVPGDARVHARHHRTRSGRSDSTGPAGGRSR